MVQKILTLVFSTVLILIPAFVSAQGIANPLDGALSTIPKFIAAVLQVMVTIGLPIIAFFMLLAGYQFVAAGGNAESINKAKTNFKWVIIGSIFILGAWVIATLIGNTVGQIVGTQISI